MVAADQSGLAAARSLIRGIAEDLGLAAEDAADVVAAAGEALSNAYAHGIAMRDGLIQMSWKVHGGVLTVRVEDDGPGFCPMDMGSDGPGGATRGNGIRLMRRLLDDVRFDFGDGTQVVMTKTLPRTATGVMQSRCRTGA